MSEAEVTLFDDEVTANLVWEADDPHETLFLHDFEVIDSPMWLEELPSDIKNRIRVFLEGLAIEKFYEEDGGPVEVDEGRGADLNIKFGKEGV